MCRPTKRPKPASAQMESSPEQQQAHVAMDTANDFKCPDIIDMKQPIASEEQDQAAIPASKQTFVFTTYQMVSDMANKAAVGFDSTGTLIQIRDATLFGEHVLPKYFRHRNVTSFYRQLNSYGFRTIKTRSVEVAHTFVCDLFRRDRPDLLPLITRKKAAPPPPALAMLKEQQQAVVAAPVMVQAPVVAQQPIAAAPTVMKMIQELQEFQHNQQMRAVQLEENIRRLSSENSKILHEGEQVISNMQDMVKNQQRVIQSLFGSKASDAFEAQLKSGAEIPVVNKPVLLQAAPQQVLQSRTSLDLDMFGLGEQADMFSVEDSFVPGDDLLELETLLAFDEDEFMF